MDSSFFHGSACAEAFERIIYPEATCVSAAVRLILTTQPRPFPVLDIHLSVCHRHQALDACGQKQLSPWDLIREHRLSPNYAPVHMWKSAETKPLYSLGLRFGSHSFRTVEDGLLRQTAGKTMIPLGSIAWPRCEATLHWVKRATSSTSFL